MKSLISLILIFFSANCFSQSLEGEWKGSFKSYSRTSKFVSDEVSINLKFVSTGNNNYEVTSRTTQQNMYEKNYSATCKVFYHLIGTDSIYLEEKRIYYTCFTSRLQLTKNDP